MADVIEHAAGFLDALKGVVHAKLHGDDVKRRRKLGRSESLGERLGVAVERGKCRVEARATQLLPARAGLVDGDGGNVYSSCQAGRHSGRHGKDRPTARTSAARAFAHFVMSPPLPQPMSRTLPRDGRGPRPTTLLAARAGWAKREIRTDLTQLLKLLRPIIGDVSRCATPTSGRVLSVNNRRC
jgi:hypothetical protein